MTTPKARVNHNKEEVDSNEKVPKIDVTNIETMRNAYNKMYPANPSGFDDWYKRFLARKKSVPRVSESTNGTVIPQPTSDDAAAQSEVERRNLDD